MKAPYALVVGDRDIEAETFTVRDRSGEEHAGRAVRRRRGRARARRSRRARSTQSAVRRLTG